MQLSREQLYAFLPHTGTMCLIDEVTSYNSEIILCRTHSHRSPENPLVSQGSLSSIHAIEYAAQAIGIHGALSINSQDKPKGGYLVSVRNVRMFQDYLHTLEKPLTIEATKAMASDALWIYTFKISAGDLLIAEGRATIMTTLGEQP